MHGGGTVGTLRDALGQASVMEEGWPALTGESKCRLASDRSLSWMGRTEQEARVLRCRAPVIHSLPPPTPMGLKKGGYRNKGLLRDFKPCAHYHLGLIKKTI